MTEHSTIGTEKVPASKQAVQPPASRTARRRGAGHHHPVSAEERERLIAVAAYHRAERRGFAPGGEFQDWCEAAAEIDRQLGLRNV